MTQRYIDEIAHNRMAKGMCPECGGNPGLHGTLGAIPRCSLREDGVEDRIRQYREDEAAKAAQSTRWPCACKMVTLYNGRPVQARDLMHGPDRCMTVADAKVQEMLGPPLPLTLEQRVETLETQVAALTRTARRAYDIASATQDWSPGR